MITVSIGAKKNGHEVEMGPWRYLNRCVLDLNITTIHLHLHLQLQLQLHFHLHYRPSLEEQDPEHQENHVDPPLLPMLSVRWNILRVWPQRSVQIHRLLCVQHLSLRRFLWLLCRKPKTSQLRPQILWHVLRPRVLGGPVLHLWSHDTTVYGMLQE
jgi:hypothetical protein